MIALQIINDLNSVCHDKKEAMKRILYFTEKQKELMNLGKITALAKEMELKDKYVREVDKLDLVFYNLFTKLKSSLNVETIDEIDIKKYPQMKELKKNVSDILELTEEIQIFDNENSDTLKKNMGKMGGELRGIKQGKRVTNAYSSYKNLQKSKKFNKEK